DRADLWSAIAGSKAVGCPRRGRGQRDDGSSAIDEAALTDVIELRTEIDAINLFAGGRGKDDTFATGRESEIHMQIAHAGLVLAGFFIRPDHQKTLRRDEVTRGDPEFGGVRRRVAEEVTTEIEGAVPGIVEFKPILVIAISRVDSV